MKWKKTVEIFLLNVLLLVGLHIVRRAHWPVSPLCIWLSAALVTPSGTYQGEIDTG